MARTFAAPPIDQHPLFPVTPAPAQILTMTGFTDRAYQIEAVGHVVGGLSGGGRGQLRAACGTGKTRMAQWSAERLVPHGGIVVIAVPTVGLVAQTLAAWADDDEDHRALAVCSDDSVALDNYGVTEDILEPVTTDADVVDAWLRMDNTAAVRLIVGTHASAHVVGEGLQKAGVVADLLVIDEAHRSSGWIGKQTALLHDDEVLPAARRLYMTATPRVWDSSKTSGKSTYSMDDERVFGPVLYNYPFSRAIDEGYLDDYRLVVIGVTRAEVLAVLRKSTRQAHAQSRLPDEHTAMVQAAIARAATELGLRRVIAFCPLVEDAKRFAATFQDTLDALPPALRPHRPLHTAHVQGTMKQAQRREILSTLVDPPDDGWTVISNARCLSEGIDVPTVDGIAFTAPKSSPVDIVQAVGRALRRDPEGSGTATVIVPILLADDDHGDDETIDAGSYDVLWQVVRGLRAHDDTFGAALDTFRSKGFQSKSVLQRLEFLLPESHRTPEFVEHLTIRLVKSTTSKWWDGYAHLAAFHAREGHTRVNHDHVTDDLYNLGEWVSTARVAHKQKRLAPDRIEALRKLDFVFDARAADWERGFRVAADFYSVNGHLRPPSKYRHDDVGLAGWLAKQRSAEGRGTLPTERKTRLDEIGMQWAKAEVWEPKLAELRAHHAEHGHLPNPKPYEHLSGAMLKIRAARKRGELDDELIAELDAMGMTWESLPMDWWDGYRHLVDFHSREGHARVPQTFLTDGKFSLGVWVSGTRTLYRNGRLEPDRVQALDTLSFVSNARVEDWEREFAAAAAFYAEHGNLHFSAGFRQNGVHLGDFVRKQRAALARGSLPAERKARLDEIGMDWATTSTWEDRVPELRAYYAERGRLPERQSYIPLAGALDRVRAAHKRGELPAELIVELDAMGMIWQPEPMDWWDGYTQLAAFHAREGHARVPAAYLTEEEFELGIWCSAARANHRSGRLASDQVEALEKLGFPIHLKKHKTWEDGYAAAQEFYDEHGDLYPAKPWRATNDVDLYNWLCRQRTALANSTLPADRKARLDTVGMDWTQARPTRRTSVSRQALQDRLSELRAFHAAHGCLPTEGTDKSLAGVLSRMRAAYRKGALHQAFIDVLDELGMNWNPGTPWWDGYAHLAAFYEDNGHVRVTGTHLTAEGFKLGAWTTAARTAWRAGRLSQDQVRALEKVGLGPDARIALWEHQFSVAEKFFTENGHLEPPQGYRSEDVSLGPWLSQQRAARVNGTLDAERETRLAAIGIEWQYKFTWEERLAQIEDYHAEHGRLPSQKSHRPLGAALSKMRAAHKKGELDHAIVDALGKLGIVWDTVAVAETNDTASWERGLAAATRFHTVHGHIDVRPSDPLHSADEGFDLSGWLKKRRSDRQKDKLTADRIAALDALGMVWNVWQATWDHAYTQCAQFYAKHGHLRAPRRYTVRNARGEDYLLDNWINTQRGQRAKLTDDQVLMLDKIGMVWDPFTSRWVNNLVALQEFHDEHGDIDVPTDLTNDDGVNLYAFLTACRARRRSGTLDASRAAALDTLGIDWEPGASGAWDRMVDALRSYHAEHGDIHIPSDYCNDKGNNVADWLYLQRKRYADGKLTDTQISDLDQLGMIWEKGRSRWVKTLRRLSDYHARHGDINITYKQGEADPEAASLRALIKKYRTAYQKGNLPQVKIDDLNALGLDWQPTDGHD